MAETYCLVMKADEPLEWRREMPDSLLGTGSPNGKSTSQKLQADSPERELSNEEAWEKERKTALAQIQNTLKFCVQS
jgi:hypothetical protein